MKQLLIVHGATALWLAVVAALLLVPAGGVGGLLEQALSWLPTVVVERSDTIGHALLFMITCLVLHRSLRAHSPTSRALLLALVGAFLYGLALELLQGLVPSREAAMSDAAANALGCGLYGGVVLVRRGSPSSGASGWGRR